jgi:CubicO group peptidase (beta-lactamase class C family)
LAQLTRQTFKPPAMRKILLVTLLVSMTTCYAQSWQDTVQKIDKLFESYNGIPGAQLAISRNGQLIFSKAWGMADMEHDIPLTTNSLTEAGSISKQFVAACILLLEQQGKLSLDDDIRKYIPELPDYGTPIKIRHMMQHTSGLKDWGAVAALTGWPRSTRAYDNNDALQITARQKTLNNVPGAEYIYSNTNYNLFAILVERVSGMSLAKFSKQYIFDPAGMKLTQWRDDYKRIVKNRAIAYAPTISGYQTEMPNEYVYGNGGLLTTAEELVQWTNYYQAGKLGTPSLLEKQLYVYPLLNGNKNNYAAGLVIQTTNGLKDINHNGATAGYRTDMHYFPDLGLTIAWMSNNARPTQVPADVLNLFVPKKPSATSNKPEAFTVSSNELKNYTGWYRNERTNDALELTIRDSNLIMQNQKMVPLSEKKFMVGAARFEFMKGGFRFINSGNDTMFHYLMPAAKTGGDYLKEFTGTYYSDESDSRIEINLVNGKLQVKNRPTGEVILSPTYLDGFTSPAGTIYFERDKKNKVTSLKVSTPRARNVGFTRI